MSFQVKWVYDLVDKITPAIQKINRNVEGSSQPFDRLASRVNGSMARVGRDINKVSLQAVQLGKDLMLKTTLPMGLLGTKFIKTASDYQESLNKVDVAFGSASENVKKFAESAGQNFGLDKLSALDMAAQFGDMATSMGISQVNASNLATSLVGLAGDLNSFKNLKGDMAKTALNAIFTGETESLKMLGVVMTETNLKQFALSKGITQKLDTMKQDEKVMLRYRYVMEMTKNAQGDFGRTISGFANQTRVLNDRYTSLSITLGNKLLPYANQALGIAISLLDKFQALSPTTQKIILVFTSLAVALPPVLYILGKFIPILFTIGAYLLRFSLINFAPLVLAFIVIKKYGSQILEIFNYIYEKIVKIGTAIGLDKLIDKISTGLGFNPIFKNETVMTQPATTNNSTTQLTGGLNINFGNMPKQTTISPDNSTNFNLGTNITYAR